MTRVKWSSRGTGVVAGALALVAGVLTVVPTAVGAAGGEMGELGIKGVGTVYAGPTAVPMLVTTAGAVGTFTFEVVNTGTVTSQYNLLADVNTNSCDPSGCPTAGLTVMAGSVNITPSITGNNGYFTAPILAGKLAVYTLKLTVPKTAVPDNLYAAIITLRDTAGNFLSRETPIVEVKDTTGTTAYDQFANGAGQSPVRAPGSAFNGVIGVSAQTIAVGQSATYTIKLQDDTTSSDVISYHLTEQSGCASAFSVSVKAGTANVTALALAGTYHTPVLAPGKSTILTVKLTLVSSPRPCLVQGDDQWASISTSGTNSADVFLVANIALGT